MSIPGGDWVPPKLIEVEKKETLPRVPLKPPVVGARPGDSLLKEYSEADATPSVFPPATISITAPDAVAAETEEPAAAEFVRAEAVDYQVINGVTLVEIRGYPTVRKVATALGRDVVHLHIDFMDLGVFSTPDEPLVTTFVYRVMSKYGCAPILRP